MAVVFCESFGLELLQGTHNFASHTFKMALFTSSATLNGVLLALARCSRSWLEMP